MPTSLPTDEALVSRAREGDEHAFRELVRRYEDRVAATVIGMLGPGADAEDVGQETFVRFYRALEQYRGEAGIGTYLTRIAINQSLKAIRRRKSWRRRFSRYGDQPEGDAEHRLAAQLESPERDSDLQRMERSELVRIGLDALTPERRAVVVLRLIEGYSTRETAEALGIAEGTVLSRLSRGLATMREALRPHMLGESNDETG
jgi:RNA polymerase sigma-70 factor (ECF subfamily)